MKKYLPILAIPAIVLFYVFVSTGTSLKIVPVSELKTPKDLNWKQINREAEMTLSQILQHQTIRGNEKLSAKLIAEILRKEGIKTTFLPYKDDPKRAILYAELGPVSDKGEGLILANHLDVVEADPEGWDQPPFSGAITEEKIYGRGAIDMKGMTVMELMSFILVKRMGIKLKRPLMFLALPDEESGSFGAQDMVTNHLEILRPYTYMINEGGLGTDNMVIPGSKIFNVQYAEKGSLWISIQAKGEAGHGSSPHPKYAAKNLTLFLNEILEPKPDITITDETESFFYQIGSIAEFPKSFFLKRISNPFILPLAKGVILGNRHLTAMTTNTKSLTVINTGRSLGPNVISEKAQAVIDMRLLPGVNPLDVFDDLKLKAKKYDLELFILEKKQSSRSPTDSELFNLITGVLSKKYPTAAITPFMSPGLTDCSVFRHAKINCYGFIPTLFTQKEIDGFHGKNESITKEQLAMGVQNLLEITLQYVGE